MNATESTEVHLCGSLAEGWPTERGGRNARER